MGLPLLVGRPFPQRVSLPLRLQQVKQKFPHLKGVTLGRLQASPNGVARTYLTTVYSPLRTRNIARPRFSPIWNSIGHPTGTPWA